MYEPFFGLDSSPFGLTPNPRFLFRSRVHHEILSLLLYGVTTSKGVMLLLGDVGTGKTTLCRALLRELPAEAESVLVLNPHLSETELVGAILDDLGLERRGSTRGELMTVLSQHLLAAGGEGKTVVVVVDEAQQMSVGALEQVRILSTLEAPDRKLLQIVLAGQPELEAKLARPELRQLNQRIAVRSRLRSLSERETFRYVEHRLRAAGLAGSLPFTWAATARVHRYSRGVPRVINLLCDRALSTAFAGRKRNVDVDTVKVAIRSVEGRPLARWARRVAAVAAVTVVAAVGTTLGLQWTWRSGWFVSHASNSVLAAVAPPAAPTRAPTARPSSAPEPSGAPVTARVAALSPPPPAAPLDAHRRLLAELITLWIVHSPPLSAVAEWPALADGAVDIASVADRYRLTATRLPWVTAGELRAIGLPALLELDGVEEPSVLLLRRIADDAVTLVDATGAEHRGQLGELDSKLAHAVVWVLWRNVDQLPADGARPMTRDTVFAVALRLHKLGYLASPLPRLYDTRLAEAVRAFQRSTGLPTDGILGPRTTLALSRVVAGGVAPSISGEPSR
jgi:general secretion pathway protein A